MDNREFKIGDVVQLKSGGPKMTVIHIDNLEGTDRCFCVWIDASENEQRKNYPLAAVQIADTEHPDG